MQNDRCASIADEGKATTLEDTLDLRLTDKVVLITGSTAGIGFAIARAIAAEGAQVYVNGRTKQRVDAAVAAICSHSCPLLSGVVLLRIVSKIFEFPVFRLSYIVKAPFDRRSHRSPFLSQQHEGHIDCDPGKPRRKTRSAFECVKVNKGPHQALLEHVFRILPIVCDSIDLIQYAPGMALA
jgi:hypothetical protein